MSHIEVYNPYRRAKDQLSAHPVTATLVAARKSLSGLYPTQLRLEFDAGWEGLTLLYLPPSGPERVRVVRTAQPTIEVTAFEGVPVGRLALLRLGTLLDFIDLEDSGAEQVEVDLWRLAFPGLAALPHTADNLVAGARLEVPEVYPATDGAAWHVSWNSVSPEPGVTYRVYWATSPSFTDLYEQPHLHTERTQAALVGAAGAYVCVLAEDLNGNIIVSSPVCLAGEAAPARLPVALRTAAVRSCTVAPGESIAYDLSRFCLPVPLRAADTPSAIWNDITIRLWVMGGSATAAVAGRFILVDAPAAAAAGAQTIVVVRLSRAGAWPLWLAWCVGVGEVTEETAYNFGGVHRSALPATFSLAAEHFVGAGAAVVSQTSWAAELARLADPLSGEVTSGLLALRPRPTGQDSDPEVLVFAGAAGYATAIIAHDAAETPNRYLLPFLPEPVVDALEVEEDAPGGTLWRSTQLSALAGDPRRLLGAAWRRVLAGTGTAARLYDVSLFDLPSGVHYAAPIYYQNLWFDRDAFPEDVEDLLADSEAGKVAVYRGGLLSPAARRVEPTISSLAAEASGADSATISWRASHPDAPETELRTLQVPVYVRQKNTSAAPLSRLAYGQARFERLRPATDYEAWVVEADLETARARGLVVPFRTQRSRPAVTIEGYAQDETHFKYRYRVVSDPSDPFTEWVDPFGGRHTETVIDLDRTEAIDKHTIAVYFGAEAAVVAVTTLWQRPLTSFEFTRTVTTGFALPAAAFEQPLFQAARHTGVAVKDLKHNIYAPGRYRVRVAGWLPPSVTGRLEDYVSATFISPDGTELGEMVEVTVQTELAVRLRVAAVGGETPFVRGVHILTR